MGKELLHLLPAHRCQVAQVVETDEGADPFHIRLLRPYAVMQETDAFAQLVEHFDRGQG